MNYIKSMQLNFRKPNLEFFELLLDHYNAIERFSPCEYVHPSFVNT